MKALKGREMVDAILTDYRTANIDERLRAMLAFLEKLTLLPSEATPADAEALRKAGVSARAAEEALYVAFCFGIMDRLADAFGFVLPDARSLRWVGRILLGPGYKIASIAP